MSQNLLPGNPLELHLGLFKAYFLRRLFPPITSLCNLLSICDSLLWGKSMSSTILWWNWHVTEAERHRWKGTGFWVKAIPWISWLPYFPIVGTLVYLTLLNSSFLTSKMDTIIWQLGRMPWVPQYRFAFCCCPKGWYHIILLLTVLRQLPSVLWEKKENFALSPRSCHCHLSACPASS